MLGTRLGPPRARFPHSCIYGGGISPAMPSNLVPWLALSPIPGPHGAAPGHLSSSRVPCPGCGRAVGGVSILADSSQVGPGNPGLSSWGPVPYEEELEGHQGHGSGGRQRAGEGVGEAGPEGTGCRPCQPPGPWWHWSGWCGRAGWGCGPRLLARCTRGAPWRLQHTAARLVTGWGR